MCQQPSRAGLLDRNSWPATKEILVSFCFVLACLPILGLCVFVLIFSLGDVSLKRRDKEHIVEWVRR